MQQRKPTAGRPSGTDGSDFSYRMVVDSREFTKLPSLLCLRILNLDFFLINVFRFVLGYTKVTKGKSRLRPLIFVQVTFDFPMLEI